MAFDPISGPVPRDEFAKLAAAPFGEALKVIKKYDPLWGLKEGEKLTWRVRASSRMHGTAYIEAATQEEADNLADDLSDASFDWECSKFSIDIDSVEIDPTRNGK